MVNVIEVNIWMDWILQQVMTKFGWLKIDNGADTVMCSDEIVCCKIIFYFWAHYYIATAIKFEITKFGHNLQHDPSLLNINFNRIYI